VAIGPCNDRERERERESKYTHAYKNREMKTSKQRNVLIKLYL